MRSDRFWFVASGIISVLVAAACEGRSPSLIHGAAGSNNGLLPEVYHGTKGGIDEFLQTPRSKVTQQRYQELSDDAEKFATVHGHHYDGQGGRLMGDIIDCALPSTQTLPVKLSIHGGGLMTPDADAGALWEPIPTPWPGDIADPHARVGRMEDIQTCLIVHLNAFAYQVKIFLSGAHVAPQGDPKTQGFPNAEAVWLATIGTPSSRDSPNIGLHVWPLPSFAETLQRLADNRGGTPAVAASVNSAALFKDYVKKRICGTIEDAHKCGLSAHTFEELGRDCERRTDSNGGIWWCRDPSVPCQGSCVHDRPAIATHLSDDDFRALYLQAK